MIFVPPHALRRQPPPRPRRLTEPPAVLNFYRNPRVKGFLRTLPSFLVFIFITSLAAAEARAQLCPLVGESAGESISAQITVNSTGAPVMDGGYVVSGTKIRLDAVATAFGECNNSCGTTYNRTVHHIDVSADISTAGSLNGRYAIGSVYGKNPNGTTAFFNVLDTQASNSTGPIYETLSIPGTYTYHFGAIISSTPCNLTPNRTEVITRTVHVVEKDGSFDSGAESCSSVGEPVNVTNGNMYLQQSDYVLPGAGGGLDVTRTYNSSLKRTGLFGYGWTTQYDEFITPYGARSLRLIMADGRAVLFTRASDGLPFTPQQPRYGQVVLNADGGYTLTLKDGGCAPAQPFRQAPLHHGPQR